jgi:hypothetical protein
VKRWFTIVYLKGFIEFLNTILDFLKFDIARNLIVWRGMTG